MFGLPNDPRSPYPRSSARMMTMLGAAAARCAPAALTINRKATNAATRTVARLISILRRAGRGGSGRPGGPGRSEYPISDPPGLPGLLGPRDREAVAPRQKASLKPNCAWRETNAV